MVNKTDFENKLISFNKKITSDKTKYLKVLKKLTRLIKKGHNFFLSKMYFTSNDVSQSPFVYQSTLGTSEFKKKQMY